MPRVRLVRHSVAPPFLRPPRKDHCIGVLAIVSRPFCNFQIFSLSSSLRTASVRPSVGMKRNWASGIGAMMDAPSAAFVIRSLARHSVRQAGSQAYRALVAAAAGARGGGSFPIHESRRASRMCIRRNSAIFLAPRRSAALAFIAVCVAECGFWPQQIDILTEARALSCFPPPLPPSSS